MQEILIFQNYLTIHNYHTVKTFGVPYLLSNLCTFCNLKVEIYASLFVPLLQCTAVRLQGGGEARLPSPGWECSPLLTIALLLHSSTHRNAIHCNIHSSPWSWLQSTLGCFVIRIFQTRAFCGLCVCQLDKSFVTSLDGGNYAMFLIPWKCMKCRTISGFIFDCQLWFLPPVFRTLDLKSECWNTKVSFLRERYRCKHLKCSRHLPLMESKQIAALGKVEKAETAAPSARFVSIDSRVVFPQHPFFSDKYCHIKLSNQYKQCYFWQFKYTWA